MVADRVEVGDIRLQAPRGHLQGALEALVALLGPQEELNRGVAAALVALVAPVAPAVAQGGSLRNIG